VSPAPPSYDEPGRTFASVWFFLTLLLGGFVLDLFFGGGIAHLPGWILAIVLVVGVDLLVVHAARSTKSLHLDADELRVGDEAIGRAEIVGVSVGVDDELPVLGWTTGMPRGMKGVTVRLDDGRDVVIPTRHADLLEAALGVGRSGPATEDQDVRIADQADLLHLAEIDRRAETVFRMAGYELPDIPFPAEELDGAAAIFVVGRPPIGFVRVDEVDGLAHVEEIAVIPKWMRQGIDHLRRGAVERALLRRARMGRDGRRDTWPGRPAYLGASRWPGRGRQAHSHAQRALDPTTADQAGQRGAILIAPSRRMTSPLSIGLATMCSTSAAYSLGSPRRLGCGTCLPSDSLASSGSPSNIGVRNSPGAIVMTRISLSARSRAIGSVMPTTPPFDAE
jgi:hypothetical protein